jgi:hypothetical protein
MKRYIYHSAKGSEPAWIESPDGGEVGDMLDITCELNDLLHAWKEKCIEADTLRQHLKIAQEVIDGKPICEHKWRWHSTGAGMGYHCDICGEFRSFEANTPDQSPASGGSET